MGHRDFDVEKKLRRDLKRTHALLADAQLLIASINNEEDNKPRSDREHLEQVHCQVCTNTRFRPGSTWSRSTVRSAPTPGLDQGAPGAGPLPGLHQDQA